ncbi:MAG: hypothetical protein ABGX04_00575 [Myxococcales bacterium]
MFEMSIAEYPDSLDFEFNQITILEKALVLDEGAERDRARPEDLARIDRFVPTDVGHDVFNLVVHLPGASARDFFSIHPRDHRQVVDVDFVSGHDTGPEDVPRLVNSISNSFP